MLSMTRRGVRRCLPWFALVTVLITVARAQDREAPRGTFYHCETGDLHFPEAGWGKDPFGSTYAMADGLRYRFPRGKPAGASQEGTLDLGRAFPAGLLSVYLVVASKGGRPFIAIEGGGGQSDKDGLRHGRWSKVSLETYGPTRKLRFRFRKTAPSGKTQDYWIYSVFVTHATEEQHFELERGRKALASNTSELWIDTTGPRVGTGDVERGNHIANSSFELGVAYGFNFSRKTGRGHALYLREGITTEDAWDGKRSLKLAKAHARYSLTTGPLRIRNDRTVRPYTVSFYAKDGGRSKRLTIEVEHAIPRRAIEWTSSDVRVAPENGIAVEAGLPDGTPVQLRTSGVLPLGLQEETTYFLKRHEGNSALAVYRDIELTKLVSLRSRGRGKHVFRPESYRKGVVTRSGWSRHVLSGLYFSSVTSPELRIRISGLMGDGHVLLDALQFEEGSAATSWRPLEPVAFKLATPTVENHHQFWEGEPGRIQLETYNWGTEEERVYQVEVYDALNRLVDERRYHLSVPPGPGLFPLEGAGERLPRAGSRLLAWDVDLPFVRHEICVSRLPERRTKADETLFLGTHGMFHGDRPARDVEMGLGMSRSLSPGALLRWNEIEPVPGRYRWEECDYRIDCVVRHGQVPVLCLAKHRSTLPEHALDADGRLDLNRLRRFIAAVVDRYRDRVRYWESFNEPKSRSGFWTDPVRFAEVESTLVDSIKSQDPSAFYIALGGLYEESFARAVWNALPKRDRSRIDAVSCHLYPAGKFFSAADALNPKFEAWQAFGREIGKPVWNTESGAWGTGNRKAMIGTITGGFWSYDWMPSQIHRGPIPLERTLINAARSHGHDFQKLFYYDGRFQGGYDDAAARTNPTMWEYDDSLNHVGAALPWLQRLYEGFDNRGRIRHPGDPGIEAYASWNGEKGRSLLAAWSSGEGRPVFELDLKPDDLRVLDTSFQARQLAGPVRITRRPLYLLADLPVSELVDRFRAGSLRHADERSVPAPNLSLEVSANGIIPGRRFYPLLFTWTAVDETYVNTRSTPRALEYRTRLTGQDWTAWSGRTLRWVERDELTGGAARLRVQCRNAAGKITERISPEFRPERREAVTRAEPEIHIASEAAQP